MMYKVNSKANCNYPNQIYFFFYCKCKLMKMKLSVGKLRLLFITFEILFENTEKKATKCN